MESIELTTTKSLTTGRMVGLTEVGRKRALSAVGSGLALPQWSLTQPAVRGLRFPPGIPSDWWRRVPYDVRMALPEEEQIACGLQRRIG
jgi:hypothetical protein